MLQSIDTCQNKESADQYHVTISRAQVQGSSRSRVFLKVDRCPSAAFFRLDRGLMSGLTCCKQRRVGRKPVNANPGLKFNRIITFSFVQSFFTAFVLRILLSLKFKTQKQYTENLTAKLQNSNQNSTLSSASLIGL